MIDNEDDDEPELASVIDGALEALLRRMPRAMPAKVVKWDAAKQRANCQVLVKVPYLDEGGARKTESVAVIPGVPVLFPGGGGFRLTCPISDGTLSIEGETVRATTGLLIWADRSLDKWLSGSGKEVDPEADHQAGLQDAVFIPGLNPFGAPLDDVPTDHLSIGFDGGMQIKIKTDVIECGTKDAAQLQFVALANLVKQELDAIKTAYNNHVHVAGSLLDSLGFPVTGSTAAIATSYTPNEVAAANLKAEQ